MWKKSESHIIETSIDYLNYSELENLKIIAGEDSCCYPKQNENYWICNCGRYNYIADDVCNRCKRDKATVFNQFNKDVVEKEIAMKAETERLLLEKNRFEQTQFTIEQKLRKRKKFKKRFIIFSCSILIIIFLYQFSVREIIYDYASNLMQSGNYSGAINTFSEIKDYKNSKKLLEECNRIFTEKGDYPNPAT